MVLQSWHGRAVTCFHGVACEWKAAASERSDHYYSSDSSDSLEIQIYCMPFKYIVAGNALYVSEPFPPKWTWPTRRLKTHRHELSLQDLYMDHGGQKKKYAVKRIP